jgi:protein-disulfide isomerase
MMHRCLLLIVGVALVATAGFAADSKAAAQDPDFLRFVERALAYYPNSSFRVIANERGLTPSGSYRRVDVERVCASDALSGTVAVVVDDVAESAWFGSAAKLPVPEVGADPAALRTFLEEFLPQALQGSLRLKATLDWADPPFRAGALLPFWLRIETGYGEYRKAAAVTADGAYVVLGPVFSLADDLVAYRRTLLADNDLVVWDRIGSDEAPVEIVEFSDLECPACRHKWPLVKDALEQGGERVKHGMVSFPLTTIHPWAFRAASASWCVAEQSPSLLLPLKEMFYDLQTEMEVSLVTQTARDFVAGNGLDEAAFNDCYLREPSLDAVHGQLELGQAMGVMATPTYFVNGWMVSMPDPEWFPALIERLAEGYDP